MTGRHFDKSLGCLVSPALDELATQLFFAGGLSARERDVITDATRESLHTVLHSKVSRLLVLELNAARVTRRVGAIVRKRCMAALRFAQRWTADRRRLEGLCAGEPGELNELSFGAGDSHRGGSTVAIVRGEGW